MRRVVVGMLAASGLAGCNFVFGLDATHGHPDAAGPDAKPLTVHLAYLQTQLAASLPGTPAEVELDDLAMVGAGPLDGTAPDPLTIGAGGVLEIAPWIPDSGAWRLVYQRTGDIPREYQNLPMDAHVIEPLFGPVARTAPDPTSGYLITPTAGPSSHSIARVFTSGTWTEGLASSGSSTVTYDYATAKSLSGRLGVPVAGDRGVLIDYASGGQCITSLGSTDFPADTVGPPKGAVGEVWAGNSVLPTITTPIQLTSVTGIKPLGEGNDVGRQQFGYLPSAAMPVFTRPADIARALVLRNPAMIMTRSCVLTAAPVTLHDPGYLLGRFARVVHTESAASRQLPGGAEVINGIAIVTPEVNSQFDVRFDAALAMNIKLSSDTAIADLFGAGEQVPLESRAGMLTLSWERVSSNSTAHFWEVALVKVQGNVLVRKRVYVTTTTSVKITGSDLEPSTEYVFEVTSFTGRSKATTGDFGGAALPQAIGIINSRSFTTPQ